MKSLLIMGLPRSATSLTYNALLKACSPPMQNCNHASGELLFNHSMRVTQYNKLNWFQRTFNAEELAEYTRLLDDFSNDFIIKDVAYPHLCKQYIESSLNYNVLWVERPLADIVSAWLRRGWYMHIRSHPDYVNCEDELAVAEELGYDYPFKLLEGAALVRNTVSRIADKQIDYADLIHTPSILYDRVEQLGYPVRTRPDYTAPLQFRHKRLLTLDIRETTLWKRLNSRSKQYSLQPL